MLIILDKQLWQAQFTEHILCLRRPAFSCDFTEQPLPGPIWTVALFIEYALHWNKMLHITHNKN